VREIPMEEDYTVDLLATTQSEGDEEAIKILADFAVDTAVNLASKVILNAITAGDFLGDCGGSIGVETWLMWERPQ